MEEKTSVVFVMNILFGIISEGKSITPKVEHTMDCQYSIEKLGFLLHVTEAQSVCLTIADPALMPSDHCHSHNGTKVI